MKYKKSNSSKTPWPTKAAMSQIYELGLWGSSDYTFYSGDGSHDTKYVNPYIKEVKDFLSSFNKKPIICDLGCGDFNIGNNLVSYSKKYYAIDIVDKLIFHNNEKFTNELIEFICLDISKDKIPAGDCVILRQVLQHLSNSEIRKILNNILATGFKYLILTEHIPKGYFEPNKDIISGQGIRLKHNSGVDLVAAPFNLKFKEKRKLLSIKVPNKEEVIETYIYEF